MDEVEKNQLLEFLDSSGLKTSVVDTLVENNITVDLICDLLADTEFGRRTRQSLGLGIGEYIRLQRKLTEASLKLRNVSSETEQSQVTSKFLVGSTKVPPALEVNVVVQNKVNQDTPIVIDGDTPIVFDDDDVVELMECNVSNAEEKSSDGSETEDNADNSDRIHNSQQFIGTKGGSIKSVLESQLERSSKGMSILKKYRKEKNINKKSDILTDDDQNFIAKTLIDYELLEHQGSDLSKSISGARFLQLADEIITVFPTEIKGTYIRISAVGKFVAGKGKLYTRWSNTRRKAIKSGVIGVSSKSRGRKRQRELYYEDSDVENSAPTTDETESISVLKKISGPFGVVRKHWLATYNYRRRQLLHDSNLTPFHYACQYPALQNDDGYKLLEDDFRTLYPGKDQNLFKKWTKLEAFILHQIGKKRASAAKNLTRTERITFALSQFSYLFPVITIFKKKGSGTKEWRPSYSEVQESFITHAKAPCGLDTKSSQRMDKLLKHGKQGLQPFVAVIGPTLQDIRQTFVHLYDEHRYEVEDPLTAVDLVFKCVHAIHTPYAFESQQIWQFIQRAIFEIPFDLVHNTYYSAVETLIIKFQKFEFE